ncbi:DUF72 domain-containing protein [Streptomyces specialis]|uniref:DUF72 domain-containing protein n=1 Tax=Streptomyces specialis TaxID=498367 RepID=UPI00099EC245|nr:DUF72 domain-containing protein [Streptomyces specialis]
MGDILIGTCSWTDRALLASGWYPPGTRTAEGRLRHYASRFPVVEVDATYYALPSARNSGLWVERTPDGFVFDVKAFSLLTGHPTRAGALPPGLRPVGPPQRSLRAAEVPDAVRTEVWRAFLDGIAPLRAAGRLGAVLLQFPPWFMPGERARAWLDDCRRRVPEDLRVTVEFRHPDWFAPRHLAATLEFLRARGLALVAVDTADGLPASMPPVAEVTCPDVSVVRFHGRNPAWGTGTKEERFRHRYDADELAAWVPRVRHLAAGAGEVHVLFNNCCGDAAVSAAETMTGLLREERAPGAPGGHTTRRRTSAPRTSAPGSRGSQTVISR